MEVWGKEVTHMLLKRSTVRFMLWKLQKEIIILSKVKEVIYKRVVTLIVLYDSETWSLSV